MSSAMAGKELELTVMDDGSGFTESTQQAMKAYFHSNPQDDLEHSGWEVYQQGILRKARSRLAVGNAEQEAQWIRPCLRG